MFSSKKNKRNADIDSLVGSHTTIRGDVHFSGGLHVDGVIEGNVIAEEEGSTLTTSPNGRIKGDVKVHNIILNGEVVGDVHALKHVELASDARVTGNVYYNIIEMTMGAAVNGSLIHSISTDENSSQGSDVSKNDNVSESTPAGSTEHKKAANQN